MKFTRKNTYHDYLQTEKGRAVLDRFLPDHARYPDFYEQADVGEPLEWYAQCKWSSGITPQILDAMVDAMNNAPIEALIPEAAQRKSLDEIEREGFGAGASPLDGEAERVALTPCAGEATFPDKKRLSLNGEWALAGEDAAGEPLWDEAVPARVPCSVQRALTAAGRLPDTTFGRNQELGRLESYKNWWLRRRFCASEPGAHAQLVFEGVANRCEVWLNGERIAAHEGMFGGPIVDLEGKLKDENELVVHLFAIPQELKGRIHMGGDRPNYPDNFSWRHTVVFNNVYGWHYSCMPSIGIWNDVRLEQIPDVALSSPFIATMDAAAARMRLCVDYRSNCGRWSGALRVVIRPKSFEGQSYCFEKRLENAGDGRLLFEFELPNARLWWPNGLGEQALYELSVALLPDGGRSGEACRHAFGVRTVRVEPLPYGRKPNRYMWQFVVNGRRVFVKGAGWCTMDALMDFSRERYDRFLKLAQIQNIQMLRAWGSGMPETDAFYELCDRYGIMVMQEWPTAWDSHFEQPEDMLRETLVLNTLRIRNHASLVLYCPGNESQNPVGEVINWMGRLAIELDGTRIFHCGEPWGGSTHSYGSYWGRKNLDFHVNMTADFFGEFGIASLPVLESVNRYLPEAEKNVYPAGAYSAFEYHTPIFGTAVDLSHLAQTCGYFAPKQPTLEQACVGSQLTQIVGVRHALERARIRYPWCTGALYYKLNDNFPAMSWASVDWYGAPKLGHYVFQKSFAPTAAFVLPEHVNFAGTECALPVYIVDDAADEGARYQVRARAYNGRLERILDQRFRFEGDVSNPGAVGELLFRYETTNDGAIFIAIELEKNARPVFDTFYFFNYESDKGSLFHLPETTLELIPGEGCVTVRNTGELSAVGVQIERPGHADSFTARENFFWLEPGAEKCVRVDATDGLTVSALNA